MDAATCLRQANDHRPSLVLEDGLFLRNLEPDYLKLRWGDKQYGYRVRTDWWQLEDAEGQSGLSVNFSECIHSEECSIRLHRQAARFRHVIRIQLVALAEAMGMELRAAHDPLWEPHPNPCHYNIVPLDAPIEDFVEGVHELLNDTFPAQKPKNDAEREQARLAQERYEALLIGVRDVVPAD